VQAGSPCPSPVVVPERQQILDRVPFGRPARAFDLVDDAVRERQAPFDALGLGQRLDRPRQAAREVQREPNTARRNGK